MSLNKLMSASRRCVLAIALIVLNFTLLASLVLKRAEGQVDIAPGRKKTASTSNPPNPVPTPTLKPTKSAAAKNKNSSAEDVAERVINGYGGRAALYAVQRNGILRGQIKLHAADGARAGKTVTKFIRKPHVLDDLLLINLELPEVKFIIGFDGKQTWTLNNGEAQEPSPETANAFRAAQVHGYEALLRYKENDSKLEYVGTNKIGTLEMDILDLITPEGARTRYEISKRTAHIMYLNYEEKLAPQGPPIKYRLAFSDFTVIQNTLVPFKTLVFENGRLVEERKLVEVAYNVQLDEKAFAAENANKSAEAAARP